MQTFFLVVLFVTGFLLRADGALYTVHSTRDILAETVANYRDYNPHTSGDQIARIGKLLYENLDSVFSNYKPRECDIPDVGDHHVHWAAVDGKMMYLVSGDKHFLDLDQDIKDTFDYEIYSPDDFFCLIDDSQSMIVQEVALRQAEY